MKKYRAVWELGDNAGYYTANRSLFAYDTIDEALDVLKRKTRLPFGAKMWIEVTDDVSEKVALLPVEKKLLVFKDDMDKIEREHLADIAGLDNTELRNALAKPVKKEERIMEVNIAECPRCGAKAINIISYTNPRWSGDKYVYCQCDCCKLKSNEVRSKESHSTEDIINAITAAYSEWNKMAEKFN